MNDVNWTDRGVLLFTFMVMVLGMVVCCSCTRTVYVPQTSIQRDSIYLTQYKRDSIYLHDSVFIRMKSDTLLIEKWHTEYIEHKVTDTLYIERADTLKVPYPVEKPIPKSMQRYANIGKVSLGIWAGILTAILIYLIIKMRHI